MKDLLLFLIIICSLNSQAQKYTVSFPQGSKVYEISEIPMSVFIEGVSCKNTAIRCHTGMVSRINSCSYTYRCLKVCDDTIDVYIRRGKKLHKVGIQIVVVHPRPIPEASVGFSKGGEILKDELKEQQGIAGSWFVGGNHWESCIIKSFNFIVLRNNKVIKTIYNEGNFFNTEVKVTLNELELGDHVLIANITGCKERGGGSLKSLEFIIN